MSPRTKTTFGLIVMIMLNLPAFAQSDYTKRVVATGFNYPWEVTLGPDGYLWLTERVGKKIRRVNIADGTKTGTGGSGSDRWLINLGSTVMQTAGQDGLMGMALHPKLLTDSPYVYVAYTYNSSGTRKTKIVQLTYDKNAVSISAASSVTLIDNLTASNDHNSGRLKFGTDGKLYYTIGDMGKNQFDNRCSPIQAQTLPTQAQITAKNYTSYQGKILRLETDGSIPPDNPVIDGVRSHIFSYGHRNPQGIIFTPNGKLLSSEHGPRSDDELNGISAGKNYGWPRVAGYNDGKNYQYVNWSSANPISSCTNTSYSESGIPGGATVNQESSFTDPEFQPPLFTFFTRNAGYSFQNDYLTWPTVAPSSIDVYTKNTGGIPALFRSALIPSLKHGRIYVVKFNSDYSATVGDTTSIAYTHNRYRDIALSSDQLKIYVITDNDGGTSGPTEGAIGGSMANPGAILEFAYDGALLSLNENRYTRPEIKNTGVQVYPLPTTGRLTVEISSTYPRPYRYELIDIAGRSLLNGVSARNQFEISIERFPAGAYFLKVTIADGQQLILQRVIKQ